MKVQIKYTVDFDKIPEEVSKRYIYLMRSMQEIVDSHRLVKIDDSNVQQFIDNCDQIRKKMYDIDIGIGDIVAICRGFASQKMGLEEVHENDDTT
jgi:hypothetical protein